MRKYALVILDSKDLPIDRFNLDIVTQPKGNGFELDVSTVSSDLEDIITKVVQKKVDITFTVNQIHDSYQKSNILANWVQKYSTKDYTMVLEYDDGTGNLRYCGGKVIKLEKNEKTYQNVLLQNLTFRQTTPFFFVKKNAIAIRVVNYGKYYPFKYPYSYGSNIVENNEITNPYLLEVPIIIMIGGVIQDPFIKLMDENGVVYNQVLIEDRVESNETLIINSAQRKIIKYIYTDDTKRVLQSQVDVVNLVSPLYDTFLRAKNGTSSISINMLDDTDERFNLIGSWRQYTL
jgi:hypothetical protein